MPAGLEVYDANGDIVLETYEDGTRIVGMITVTGSFSITLPSGQAGDVVAYQIHIAPEQGRLDIGTGMFTNVSGNIISGQTLRYNDGTYSSSILLYGFR